jgi:hypothetical protein
MGVNLTWRTVSAVLDGVNLAWKTVTAIPDGVNPGWRSGDGLRDGGNPTWGTVNGLHERVSLCARSVLGFASSGMLAEPVRDPTDARERDRVDPEFPSPLPILRFAVVLEGKLTDLVGVFDRTNLSHLLTK